VTRARPGVRRTRGAAVHPIAGAGIGRLASSFKVITSYPPSGQVILASTDAPRTGPRSETICAEIADGSPGATSAGDREASRVNVESRKIWTEYGTEPSPDEFSMMAV